MSNRLLMKRSAVQGRVPLSGDLVAGELAVNSVDGKLFMRTDAGDVVELVATIATASTSRQVVDEFSNQTGTGYTLSQTPISNDAVNVYLNGQRLMDVASRNTVTNPSFETDMAGWFESDEDVINASSSIEQAKVGAASAKLVYVGGGPANGRIYQSGDATLDVSNGTEITGSCWYKGSGSAIGKTGLATLWQLVSTHPSPPHNSPAAVSSSLPTLDGAWQFATATATIDDSNTTAAQIYAGLGNFDSGDVVYIDDVKLYNSTPSLLQYKLIGATLTLGISKNSGDILVVTYEKS